MTEQLSHTHSGLWSGIEGEIETTGILPVPAAQRKMTSGKMLNLWAMTSASATTPLVALLLYSYGLWYMIGGIVVTWALFAIPTGILSEMGREVPLTIMIVARRTFGWTGSFAFSVLFTVINLAFFGLNAATGAEILAGLAHTSVAPWYWLVGGAEIILVLFGMKWLEYFYRYTSAILIASYAALTAYLFTHFTLHVPHQTTAMQWGAAISLVAGFSIIGWAYDMSTVSRFARPVSSTGRGRGPYFILPSIGIMAPVLLMGVMGMFSIEATGTWNIALLGAKISGWGAVAALGVTLAVLHCNALNLYPSTMDMLVITSTYRRRVMRWEQPVVTVIFGILGTLLAAAGILNHVSTFVDDLGDIVAPYSFVVIVDWLWGLRQKTDAETYFTPLPGWRGQLQLPAIVATVIGFVISFWGSDFLPASFVNNVPLLLVGALVSALLYGLVLVVAKRTRLDVAELEPVAR